MRRARRVAAPAAACVAAKVAWDLSRPAAAESSGDGPVVRRSSVTDDVKWRGIAWSPRGVPEREHQIEALKSGKPFDVLVIGAGATGCGVTLDAATRGLKTACVDKGREIFATDWARHRYRTRLAPSPPAPQSSPRHLRPAPCASPGDFACETSSRSSKLLWGGSKYIATAAASLFSWGTLSDPIGAVKAFYSEMKMVYNCHQERTFMMETHPHLVNWIPLAIPIREWHPAPRCSVHTLLATCEWTRYSSAWPCACQCDRLRAHVQDVAAPSSRPSVSALHCAGSCGSPCSTTRSS